MRKYKGKGVYGAYASGKISIFKRQDISVKRFHTEDSEAEKARIKSS